MIDTAAAVVVAAAAPVAEPVVDGRRKCRPGRDIVAVGLPG